MSYLCRILFFLPVVTLLYACGQADPPYEPGPRPVETIIVGQPQHTVTRSFSGMAKASADTLLSFRVAGALQTLPVQVGQKVRPGELIARLDPTDYQLRVLELKAQVIQAEAVFTKADNDYARLRPLFEDGIISKSTLDEARAGLDSARAVLDAVRKNLELVRQQLAYTRLTAPVAGTVSAVPVENFQTVQSGQPIAVLSTDHELEFEVGLPDHVIHFINQGDQAEVVFDVLPGWIFPARVSEIAITPGLVSTYPVKLRLEKTESQAASRIRPGMVGEARFEIRPDNGKPFVTVPPQAVFGLPNGSRAVWLVDQSNNTVFSRPVIVGRLLAEGLRIQEGLVPGDLVVIRGVHRLEHGHQVRLQNHAPDTVQ